MKGLATALLVLVLASAAGAVEPVGVYSTQMYCYAAQDLLEVSQDLGELPLFTGWGMADAVTPEGAITSLEGPVMMFVNQDTGTWIMTMLSPQGEICSLTVGAGFEPYSR